MAKTLQQLLEDMIGANESLAGSIGNQQNFADILKNAISSKFGGNEDLIKKQAEQASAYFNAPSQAREKYQDVFDPFARERLVSEYQNQQGQGLSVASELLKERRGSQAELLQAGVGGFQSYLQGQQAKAQGAQTAYQTAYQKRQDELQRGLGKLEILISSGSIATMGDKALKLLAQSTGYTLGQLRSIRDRVKRQLAQKEEERQLQLSLQRKDLAKPYYKSTGGGGDSGSLKLTEYNRTSIGDAKKLMSANAKRSDIVNYLAQRGYNNAEIISIIGNYQPKAKKKPQPKYSGPGVYNPQDDSYTVLPGQNPTVNY